MRRHPRARAGFTELFRPWTSVRLPRVYGPDSEAEQLRAACATAVERQNAAVAELRSATAEVASLLTACAGAIPDDHAPRATEAPRPSAPAPASAGSAAPARKAAAPAEPPRAIEPADLDDPSNLRCRRHPDGGLLLQWDGPGSATFAIWRSVQRGAQRCAAERIGEAPARRFLDRAIPRGATGVSYTVRAIKDGALGAGSTHTTIDLRAASRGTPSPGKG